MANENPKPGSFLTDLINKNEILNGKAKPKYTGVFVLKSVICDNCKNACTVPPGLWSADAQALQELAEAVHANGVTRAKVLCATPKLFFSYDCAFIDSKAVK